MINLLGLSTGLIVGISIGCVAVVALVVVLLLIFKKPKNGGIITVSYETNGGEELETVIGQAGEHLPVAIPVRHGYLFNGWYDDETLQNRVDDSVFPEKDMTFYAEWKEYGDKEFEEELEGNADLSMAISSSDVAEVKEVIPEAQTVSESEVAISVEEKSVAEEAQPKEKVVKKKRTAKSDINAVSESNAETIPEAQTVNESEVAISVEEKSVAEEVQPKEKVVKKKRTAKPKVNESAEDSKD